MYIGISGILKAPKVVTQKACIGGDASETMSLNVRESGVI
jgi:hypothetical protein